MADRQILQKLFGEIMGVPVSGKHAIEVATFVVVFQRPFSTRAVGALSTLQETLRADFPSFQTTNVNVIEFRIGDGVPQSPVAGPISGVLLQRIGSDGKPSWTLKAEGNALLVQCFAYETWVTTSHQALKFLQTAINIVADEENPPVVLAHQIIDRFVASKDGYEIGHVFNKRSEFISKHALTAGLLWHVFQGWFEHSNSATGQLLNVLNLSTNETPSGIVTTIDHNAQFQSAGISNSDATNPEWLKGVFDELHAQNKEIVGNLLNVKQKKAVGL